MAETVAQIRQKIAKLQAKEEALLSQEIEGVVARIKEAIAYYKLTPEHLFGSALKTSARARDATRVGVGRRVETTSRGDQPPKASEQRKSLKGAKLPPKFKDSDGNTWSGRGSQPRWLKAAIVDGKKLEDFAV